MKKLKVKNLLLTKQTNFSLKRKVRGLKLQILTFLLCMGLFVGCNKTANEISPENQATSKSNARVEGNKNEIPASFHRFINLQEGFLDFSDPYLLEETVQTLSKMSRREQDNWDKEMKFTSMRNLYEQAIDEQEKWVERAEKLDKKEQENLLKQGAKYTKFVKDLGEMLLYDKDGVFYMNISPTKYSCIVNKNGIVKVAGYIFQYSKDFVKIIKDGDSKKIPLLYNLTSSNKQLNIEVIKVNSFSAPSNGRAEWSFYLECENKSNGNNFGSEQVIGKAEFVQSGYVEWNWQVGYTGFVVYTYTYKATAVNRIFNIFGWSLKRTGFLRIVGNTTFTLGGLLPQTRVFDVGTNGNLMSELSHEIYYGASYNFTDFLQVSGAITYYGRADTFCTINL